MIASQQEIYAVLREYNPWWDNGRDPYLPTWTRVAFEELMTWVERPPSKRAVLVSGARQVGKTTLLRQAIRTLIDNGVSPDDILYATFDHPLLKLVGLETVLKVWEEFRTHSGDTEYLFLDEIQYTSDWQTWIKHQVDFKKKQRRIAVTGSAIPLIADSPESGVGRLHNIKLPTLSFFEYLKIKEVEIPDIQNVWTLNTLLTWDQAERTRVAQRARPLIPHFHEYLLRGGFPETAKMESVTLAQKLLREDIVDKVLKRDMTALYGVRHILDLEKLFLYLCLYDGGLLDVKKIGDGLELTRPKVNNFLSLLESAHLIYKLHPFGYGKQILKGQHKVYLADAAIAGSVLLKGKSLLEDSGRLSAAVETAFFKHVFTRFYPVSVGFSYWRHKQTGNEVDIVADVGSEIVPFEVKYRGGIEFSELKGIFTFCAENNLDRAYVITRELEDFQVHKSPRSDTQVIFIPAILACYWLSKSEIE